VYCSISGFGQDGPYSDRAALDLVVQAEGGMISVTGEPGGPGVRAGISIADITAGMYAAFGVMTALHTKPYEEWDAILCSAGVPVGAINTIDAVVDHPQVQARGSIVECRHPIAGTVKMVGPPIRLSENAGTIRTPAPLLGEHTDEVLRRHLGLGDEEIQQLRRLGVIGPQRQL
jgi:crotonobetainyl-CoA:carnitine CoA-transferase CaiB-like acyl-CoA transferase